MIVFVVLSGIEFPQYQFSFSFILAIFSCLFFGLASCKQIHDFGFKHFTTYWNFNTCLIGLFWACNYVFLLVSNPYTPGLVQVILNELNLVVIVLFSRFVHKKKYEWLQYVGVVLVLLGGLVPLFQSESGAASSSLPSWVWYIFYTFGTIPIALANVRTERILQTDKEIKIAPFFFVINVWAIVFTLALFWFPMMVQGNEFSSYFIDGIVAICSFKSKGSLWVWLGILFSLPSTICTAQLSRDEDATFTTMVLSVAPGFSGIFMGIKPFMGGYFQPVGFTIWISMAVVFFSTLYYKIVTYFLNKRKKVAENTPLINN
jgi:hypothetical protein